MTTIELMRNHIYPWVLLPKEQFSTNPCHEFYEKRKKTGNSCKMHEGVSDSDLMSLIEVAECRALQQFLHCWSQGANGLLNLLPPLKCFVRRDSH